jgi:methionine-gamma-lyase
MAENPLINEEFFEFLKEDTHANVYQEASEGESMQHRLHSPKERNHALEMTREEQIGPEEDHIQYLKEQVEFPILARLFATQLVEEIKNHNILPTKRKIKITEQLFDIAKLLIERGVFESEEIDPEMKKFAPIAELIAEKENWTWWTPEDGFYKAPEETQEVFDLMRKLAEDKDDWDPALALKNAPREFGEHGGVNQSVCKSSTFTTMHPDSMTAIFHGEKPLGLEEGCFLYLRHFAPNTMQLGNSLAALEGTDTGWATASGMSSIMTTLLQHLEPGAKVAASRTIYGGTFARLKNFLPKWGVEVDFANPGDTDEFESIITPGTKIVYTETLANPDLSVANIRRLADKAHECGALLMVDNTFTPAVFNPMRHGADAVVHSLTKFIGGRSDVTGGGICCNEQARNKLMDLTDGEIMLMGPVLSQEDAWQLNTYLQDLPTRMKAHSERAMEIAKRLEQSGENIRYTGLESHPQHELAKEMMNEEYGFGGMITMMFEDQEVAKRFVYMLQKLRGGFNAVSLGYFDTLVSISGVSTSSEVPKEEQAKMGLTPGLTRVSMGFIGKLEEEWQKTANSLWFARRNAQLGISGERLQGAEEEEYERFVATNLRNLVNHPLLINAFGNQLESQGWQRPPED